MTVTEQLIAIWIAGAWLSYGGGLLSGFCFGLLYFQKKLHTLASLASAAEDQLDKQDGGLNVAYHDTGNV